MRTISRTLPVRWLFALGHAPLGVFAVGIAVSTFLVVGSVQQRADEIARGFASTVQDVSLIRSLGDDFVAIWLISLAAFIVFLLAGTGMVAWTHRQLSMRIARIVDYAEAMGRGEHAEPLRPLQDDALGTLEGALGRVSAELERRAAALQQEASRHTVASQVQRAMTLTDTEEEAVGVVGRVLAKVAPDVPATLLLADSSRAHLRPAWASPNARTCGVESPSRCPAVQQGRGLTFPDSTAIDACTRLVGRAPCAAACVPVTVMGRAVGVLHVTGEQGVVPAEAQVATFEALANSFGARIGVLRALATSQLQAETDGLTGLLNRRSLEARAAELLQPGTVAAVAMADLDHFKRLNDTYGHAAGDRALRLFAQVLRATVRPVDVVARCGGEEFVVLLPGCSQGDAAVVLERVREALARSTGRGDVPAFTASFGLAAYPDFGGALEDVLRSADEALYQAKTEGRDRVVLAGRGEGRALPSQPVALTRVAQGA